MIEELENLLKQIEENTKAISWELKSPNDNLIAIYDAIDKSFEILKNDTDSNRHTA